MTETNTAKPYTFDELVAKLGDRPTTLRARIRKGDIIEITVKDNLYYVSDEAIEDYQDRCRRATVYVNSILVPENILAGQERLLNNAASLTDEDMKELGLL